MADYNEAFKIKIKPLLRFSKTKPVSLPNYDTTCPKCAGHGYCVTNDGGSVGGCLKCGITYKSKIRDLLQPEISNRRCIICGLTRGNHNTYHLFR